MLRTIAEFSCDMPYDSVEEDGEFLRMPGLTVAEALCELIVGLGWTAEPVESGGDHGWFFDFRCGAVRITCELTVIDGVVAQFFGPTKRRRGAEANGAPAAEFAEILSLIGEAIAADSRFGQLGWFAPGEVTRGEIGAATPTGSYDPSPCRRAFGPAPAEADWADAQERLPYHAWADASESDWTPAGLFRRTAARLFDHLVVVGGGLVLIVSWLQIPPPAPLKPTNWNFYIAMLIVTFGGALLNALLLSRISTTPGKWLCGLRVERDGGPLSFSNAVKREAEAVTLGCALFEPLLLPIFILANFFWWNATGSTPWDRRRHTTVLQAPNASWAFLTFPTCLFASFYAAMELLMLWSPRFGH